MDLNDYTIEELEEIMDSGRCEVECSGCGEWYTLEPDGCVYCHDCGALVQSPLLASGLI